MLHSSAVYSLKGTREKNEDNGCINRRYAKKAHDSFLISETSWLRRHSYFGVFDGLGGGENGDTASYICAGELSRLTDADTDTDTLEQYVEKVNGIICSRRSGNRLIGTAAVVAELCKNKFRFVGIGDARLYLFRKGNLYLLTQDDSVERFVLTQFLGKQSNEGGLSYEISPWNKIGKGDILLLCTDGVWSGIEKLQLLSILQQKKSAVQMAVKIVRTAAKTIKSDNATALVVRF